MACSGSQDVFRLVGTTERTTIELAAPVSETIIDIPVDLGQRVEAGQVVVLLDTAVAAAELKAAEAGYAAASASLEAAEREFTRLEGLRKARVASASEYDRARRERDEALAVTAEREARIAQATKRLEDLTVRSYAAGVVEQLPFEKGERSAAGGVVAVVLADETPWVRIWVPARAVARLSAGSQAEVEIEGRNETYRGRVVDVASEAEFTPHYALTERESAHLVYRARVLLEDAPANLRPGLAARVRLEIPPGGGADG